MPSFEKSFLEYLEQRGLTYAEWRKQRGALSADK